MPEVQFINRLKHAWNAFQNRDPTGFDHNFGKYSKQIRSLKKEMSSNSKASTDFSNKMMDMMVSTALKDLGYADTKEGRDFIYDYVIDD